MPTGVSAVITAAGDLRRRERQWQRNQARLERDTYVRQMSGAHERQQGGGVVVA